MSPKSCLIVLNRITGAPIGGPNKEGQTGLFNPGALAFAVGNCNPGLEPGRGLRGLRMPEACIYKPDHEGSMTLTSQFPLRGRNPRHESQWPVNNWTSALILSELVDGVYFSKMLPSKHESFKKIPSEKIVGSLSQCEFDIKPQMGWLHMVEDGVEGGKPVTMKAGRFGALMRSRFFEISSPLRRSQEAGKVEAVNNLEIKFRTMLTALQDGVDDKMVCVFSVQFSEAFEEVGIENHEGLLTCLHLLNGKKDQEINFSFVPGQFGKKPETGGWITPVIQSSPIWVWNRASILANEDHGFENQFPQERIDEMFLASR